MDYNTETDFGRRRRHHRHILMCYKNFSKDCDVSHIGLGVTAQYTAKSLTHAGYHAQAMPIFGAENLDQILSSNNGPEITHVVIMAQFIPTEWLAKLCRKFPFTKFVLNCHSNVGFLQAEPGAIRKFREAIDLETGTTNFFASGNNQRFVDAVRHMYGRPVQFLPNLYFTHGEEPVHRQGTGAFCPLRIGAFGSHRIYKNFSTAVAAAMILSHKMKVQTELWINSGRHDGHGNIVYQTAKAWTTGMPNIELKEFHWTPWPEFKRWVGTMDIMLQPSYTETFNNVTADGVCEGVPSVVSDTIDWCPDNWKASTDDAEEVADVARRLLSDPGAATEGYRSLTMYVRQGLVHWEKFLARP